MPAITSRGDVRAVRITTGTRESEGCALICLASASPSMRGIIRSVTSTSGGGPERTFSRASSPSDAVTTSPRVRSTISSIFRRSGSSSATRMRGRPVLVGADTAGTLLSDGPARTEGSSRDGADGVLEDGEEPLEVGDLDVERRRDVDGVAERPEERASLEGRLEDPPAELSPIPVVAEVRRTDHPERAHPLHALYRRDTLERALD